MVTPPPPQPHTCNEYQFTWENDFHLCKIWLHILINSIPYNSNIIISHYKNNPLTVRVSCFKLFEAVTLVI